jgi:hypothetical protein
VAGSAIGVVAALAYPRLPAGARAVLALSIGLVATVGGAAEAGSSPDPGSTSDA